MEEYDKLVFLPPLPDLCPTQLVELLWDGGIYTSPCWLYLLRLRYGGEVAFLGLSSGVAPAKIG